MKSTIIPYNTTASLISFHANIPYNTPLKFGFKREAAAFDVETTNVSDQTDENIYNYWYRNLFA